MTDATPAASLQPGKKARIAVIGNSHSACLKLAWDHLGKTHDKIESIVFFARPEGKGGIWDVNFGPKKIRPKTPELSAWFLRTAGVDSIEYSQYDAFILAAFGADTEKLLASDIGINGQVFSKSLLELVTRKNREQYLKSFQVGEQYTYHNELRKHTDTRVFALCKPLVSEDHEKYVSAGYLATLLHDIHTETLENYLAEKNISLVKQPEETIVRGCFTRREFMKPDMKHGAQEYGLVMLEKIATALG